MTRLVFVFTVCFLFSLNVKAQRVDYCQLSGSVFVSEDRQGVDYFVYEDDSEAFADILVFEEENKLYADEPGLWFFVDNKGLADFKIYFTKNKGEADFIIHYTDSPTFAGCN